MLDLLHSDFYPDFDMHGRILPPWPRSRPDANECQRVAARVVAARAAAAAFGPLPSKLLNMKNHTGDACVDQFLRRARDADFATKMFTAATRMPGEVNTPTPEETQEALDNFTMLRDVCIEVATLMWHLSHEVHV